MHSITLDSAASILLLSSIISIGLVLKRTPKSRLKSSNSILSISDLSSSVLTAVMLFFHYFYIDNGNDFVYRINQLNNTRYFYETFYKSRSDHDGNSTSVSEDAAEEKCDYKSVLLQYATFLIPFVNAFISLLSFSTSFYTNAMKMNCRCCELSVCRVDLGKSMETSEKDTVAFENVSDSRKFKNRDKSTRSDTKKSKIFDWDYTNFAIIGQWIIPALFTSVFQLGEYQRINVSNDVNKDLICTITANFPFENCLDNINSTSGILSVDSIGSYSSVYNYVNSEDNLLWPHPNSTRVTDVVSKIYNIVQSVTNDSKILNASLPDRHYNITQLLQIMSHKNIKNLTTMEELMEKSNYTDSKETLSRNFDLEEGVNSLVKKKQKSYVMHSFADKILNDNEQPSELNNMLIMQCLKNRCMVSTKFLKIYLFILLTFIYFAPILVSALVLMKSYYKFREITEKLENNKSKLESEIKRSKAVQEDNVTETNIRQRQSNALQLGWFSENLDEEIGQEAAAAEETEQSQTTEPWSALEKITCELTCETEKMQSLFKIFKVNAMVAVALWTPFFLQILSKVFLCSNVPSWLMETTFLATIVFSIFKNGVNVNVIKIETDTNNAVYPSKLDLL